MPEPTNHDLALIGAKEGLRGHIETAQRLTGIWKEQDATDDAVEVPE